MNKKYEFTGETMEHNGRILYRIKALKDFGNVKEGQPGGWIEKESNLSHNGDCWVSDEAKVYEYAGVYGHARIYDNACVYDHAQIYGRAQIYGHAHIYDNARVCGDTMIRGNALIYDHAVVCGDAEISSRACIQSSSDYFVIIFTENTSITIYRTNNNKMKTCWSESKLIETIDELSELGSDNKHSILIECLKVIQKNSYPKKHSEMS